MVYSKHFQDAIDWYSEQENRYQLRYCINDDKNMEISICEHRVADLAVMESFVVELSNLERDYRDFMDGWIYSDDQNMNDLFCLYAMCVNGELVDL